MADIFLSYANNDRDRAQRLAEALITEGLNVWWDPDIRPGRRFVEVIERELEVATCVVVLWSETSIQRRWVYSEAEEGAERLVPVMIDNVKPPLPFGSIRAANLIHWTGQRDDPEFRGLVEELRTRVVHRRRGRKEGEDQDELQSLARCSFEALLEYSYGANVVISKDQDPHTGIDRRSVLLSSSAPLNQLTLNWKIEVGDIAPGFSDLYKDNVFVWPITASEHRNLKNALASSDPLLVALGIPNHAVTDLREYPPLEQFQWYALDVREFLDRPDVDLDSLNRFHIPCANRLSLGTLTLLWGAHWFKRLTDQVNRRIAVVDPLFRMVAEGFIWDGGRVESIAEMSSRHLPASYRLALGDIPTAERSIFNFLYGTALTQFGILDRIFSRGRIPSYSVYAVESLGEELNLWLFSKQVRSFGSRLRRVVFGEKPRDYLRMFPLPQEISLMPRYVRCAFFYVICSHKYHNIDTALVTRLNENEPTDHAVAGDIGSFRTFVIDQTDSWKINFKSKNVETENELLTHIEKSYVLDGGLPQNSLMKELFLAKEDVLIDRRPEDLLVREDKYLAHPNELWSPSRRGSGR